MKKTFTPDDLRKLALESREITELAGAGEIASARAVLAIADRLKDSVRLELEETAQINNVDIEQDFRYMIGFINGMKLVISLPRLAREVIKQAERG